MLMKKVRFIIGSDYVDFVPDRRESILKKYWYPRAIRRAAKAEGYKEISDGVFSSDRVTTLEEFGDSLSKMAWAATLPFYACYNGCSSSVHFLWLGKCISECSDAGAPLTFAEYCAGNGIE